MSGVNPCDPPYERPWGCDTDAIRGDLRGVGRVHVANLVGAELLGEFVDKASAYDLRGRRAWRRLLGLAQRRQVDLILVWRVERAFRSVLDGA